MKHCLFICWLGGVSLGLGFSTTTHSMDSDHISHSTTESSTQTKSQLSMSEKASFWGVTESEYSHYTQIMEGPLKFWNPDIDPVMALGIYAQTESEQRRFAELYAAQEFALISKTQAFERAYHAAFRRLYPNAKMVSPELMAPYYKSRSINPSKPINDFAISTLIENDRVLFFAQLNCKDCAITIEHLQNLVRRKKHIFVDIYILDISSGDQARNWAKQNQVDIDLVTEGSLTINVDKGVYNKLNNSVEKNSMFYLHRDDTFFALTKHDVFLQ